MATKKKVGRPTDYSEDILKKAQKYLSSCKDEIVSEIESENDKTGRTRYIKTTKVNLPSIEGLALFLKVNRSSIYEWEKQHEEFSNTLEDIRAEQQKRLVNNGLAGTYNSTIAKLILSSNHGMVERKDVTSANQPLGLDAEAKEKAAKARKDAIN